MGSVIGIVVLALAVAMARADPAPPPVVVPCQRLGLSDLRREISHRREGLRLRLATAEAVACSRVRRHTELQRLEQLGHASRVESEAAAVEVEVTRDRALTFRNLVAATDALLAGLPGSTLEAAGAAPAAFGPPVRLKVPGLTRRIGALEYFTLPLPKGWVARIPNQPPPPLESNVAWPGAELWAERVDALEELGSTRETELDAARCRHLAAQTQAWALEASTRDSTRLLQFFRSGGHAWPVTEDDLGTFATSWRQAVPASGPHLRPSLAWAEAAARHCGPLRLRELEEQRAREIVDVLESALERGTGARSSLQRARAELQAAAAGRQAELARIRVRVAERDWLGALASGPEGTPATVGKPSPPVTTPVSSVWILGHLRLREQQALHDASVREAERRLQHALTRRDQFISHPTRHQRDRASVEREVARREALRLIAHEASELSQLELLQWDAVRHLPPADSNAIPPPEVLASLRVLADAESVAASALVETLLPESALLQDRVRDLERLLSRGAARPYELAQARDAARIADAKADLARLTHAGSIARADLLTVMATPSARDGWRPLMARCHALESQAVPVIAAGLAAADSRASRRADELDRLQRLGHASASEVSRARAQHGALVWLRSAEDTRETLRELEADLALQAVTVPPESPPLPQLFELPPLE